MLAPVTQADLVMAWASLWTERGREGSGNVLGDCVDRGEGGVMIPDFRVAASAGEIFRCFCLFTIFIDHTLNIIGLNTASVFALFS